MAWLIKAPRLRWSPIWLVPFALSAIAAGLRFYRIDAQSLWYDEGISAFQLTRDYAEIARAAAGDTHPPLYYWLLKAWGTLFGATELGLRSLSAVLGVAAVAVLWLLGRILFGTLAATCAALLLAISPLAVYYAQEVRMYTLVVLLGLVAAYAYARRSYALYALAAAATLYSQYLGAALLAALHLHSLATWRARPRCEWVRWLGWNAVAALLFLPWLPVFVDQSTQRALNTSPRAPGALLRDTLAAMGGGLATGDLSLLGGIVLVALAVVGVVLGPRRSPGATLLGVCLWVAPLLLVLTLALRSGLFEQRYLLLSVPGMALLAGSGAARLAALSAPRRAHRVAAPLLALLLLVPSGMLSGTALQQQYFDPRLARDDYRGVAATIATQARPTDAIVLAAPNQVEVFSFYYRGPLPLYPLPAQRPIDVQDTLRRLEAIRQQYGRVWLVSWALRQADPDGVIEQWLATEGFQESHAWYGTVQLALYTLARSVQMEQVNAPLDNGITLEAVGLGSRTLKAGDTLALRLAWRAREVPTERWKVFTHLLDARPSVVTQRDAEPGGALRPTTTWQAGELIQDNYGIPIPPGLPPGRYTIEVGMYRGEQRAQFVGKGDRLLLGAVEIVP